MLDELFNDKKPDFQQLLSFGFVNIQGAYRYTAAIVDGQFTLDVHIHNDRKVYTELVEVATQETYVLHLVHGASGGFIGRIKEEYTMILTAIAEKCFVRDVFKSDCAKRILEHVRNTYQGEPEYLWEKFPLYAIFRRKDTTKWYAVLLVVPAKKIGLNDDRYVEIVDLRVAPERLESLLDGKRYFPGYHMNKKHWVTICLDGSVPVEEIFKLIDASYALAKK